MSDTAGQIKVVIEGDSSSLVEGAGKGRQAIGDLGQGTDKAAESTRIFSSQGREMHRVIGELNRISPVLGEALRIAMHPVGGSIAAAIGLFVMFKREIDETNKKLDELGAAAAQPDFLAGIQAKLDVLRNAATAAADYAEKLADIKRGEHGVGEELKDQLELDKAIERARAALTSAQKGLDIAKIQEAEAGHRISPEQAAEARAVVEKKYIQQQQDEKERAEDNELKRKMEALGKANAAESDLVAKQTAAAKAQAAEEGKRARDEKDFGDVEKYKADLEAATKAKEAAQKGIETIQSVMNPPEVGGNTAIQEAILAKHKTELEIANANSKQIQQGRSKVLAERADDKTLNDLQSANLIATAALNKNTEVIGKLAVEIPQLGAAIAATRPIERQTTGVKMETLAVTERERVEKSVEADVSFITHFEHANEITPELVSQAAQKMRDLQEALAAHKELYQFIGSLGMTVQELRQAQDTLRGQMAALSTHK